MKDTFPDYKKEQVLEIKKNLDSKSKEILNDFLKFCGRSAGENTIKKIERQVLQYQDISEKPLSQKPTQEDLTNFLSLIKEKRDRQKLKVNIKRFLKWKWKDLELLEILEFKWNKNLIPKYSESDMLSPEDIEKLIRNANSLMWKSAYMLVFETGCRPSELTNLKWKDIRFQDNSADIVIYSKKTGETRIYPVVSSVVHLKRWKQEYSYPDVKSEDYVFPSPRAREKALTIHAVLYSLQRNAKKLGIADNKMTTYLMRHSKATELYQKLPEQVVEKLLGHKGMAKFYTHLSSEKARQELINKVYNIKELSPETKTKLELEIAQLKETIAGNNELDSLIIKKLLGQELTQEDTYKIAEIGNRITGNPNSYKVVKK